MVVLSVLLLRRVRRKDANSVAAAQPARDATVDSPPRSSSNWSWLPLALALLTAVTAIVSNILTYEQLRLSNTQSDTAMRTYEQSLRVEDLKFVGRLSASISGDTISISNESELPVINAAVWTVGFNRSNPSRTRLDTVRAPLAGFGACRTMRFSKEELMQSVAEDLANAVANDAYLTVQGPSGRWYTISSRVSAELASIDAQNAIEAASRTESDVLLLDTAAEGFDESPIAIADAPVGPQLAVSEYVSSRADIVPNSCSGP